MYRKDKYGEEGLWETKNNAFGLATEDRGKQYQLYEELKMSAQDRSIDGVNEDGNLPYGRAPQRDRKESHHIVFFSV